MIRCFLNEDQSICQVIDAGEEIMALNTPADAKYVDIDEVVSLSDYWNGIKVRQYRRTTIPATPHFDYTTKTSGSTPHLG